jgi:hypothetical protein
MPFSQKIIIALFFTFIFPTVHAEITKTVNVTTAGALSTSFSDTEKSEMVKLKVTGIINSIDFTFMRSELTKLSVLDLSEVAVVDHTIPDFAFQCDEDDKTTLDSIYLPESITTIGEYAFAGCSRLKAITIPASITTWGEYIFGDCTSLNQVTFAPGLASIGLYAFHKCTELTSLIIPSSVKSIEEEAFSNCSKLTSVTLSKGLESIETSAFAGCTNLRSIHLPASLTVIGTGAFLNTRCSFTIDPENPFFSLTDEVLFNKNATNLILCPASKKGAYTVPETVDTIASSAFICCDSLTSIKLPASLTTIGSFAFALCTGLTSFQLSANVSSIGHCAFMSVPLALSLDAANPYFELVDGVLFNENKTNLMYCSILKTGSYAIPETVDTIGPRAFDECSGLTSVTLPASLTHIGEKAFYACTGLTSVYTYSPTPLSINWVFNYDAMSEGYLYIPKGSLALYQAMEVWNSFGHIIELNKLVSTQNALESGENAIVCDGILKISGLIRNTSLSVYTIDGRKIFSEKSLDHSDVTIALPNHGIYLVQSGSRNFKVVY